VTPARVIEHLDTLRPAPPTRTKQRVREALSPRTVNHVRKHLRAIFKAAIARAWFVGANPVENVPMKPVKRRTLVTLTADEASRLIAAAPFPWRGIVAVALLGLRKGEVFGLSVDDVDTERWEIHVRRSHDASTTKSGRERTVPITARSARSSRTQSSWPTRRRASYSPAAAASAVMKARRWHASSTRTSRPPRLRSASGSTISATPLRR
jgi:integrase